MLYYIRRVACVVLNRVLKKATIREKVKKKQLFFKNILVYQKKAVLLHSISETTDVNVGTKSEKPRLFSSVGQST